MATEKERAVALALAALEERHQRALAAAGESHAYATDEDSAAESKYDTRSLEASYLAAGQAGQAEALGEAVDVFRKFQFSNYTDADTIGPGGLVEAELEGDICYYLLAPSGGGTIAKFMGVDLVILSAEAPLYHQLEGKRAGDVLEDPQLTIYELS